VRINGILSAGISAKGPGIAVRVDYPGSRIVKGVA
jgi:hypothetical protein